MSREPSIFDVWGREQVKDLTLLVLAIPPLVGLLYLPLAPGAQRWWVPVLVVVGGALLWWLARRVLRAWVARGGDRTKG